MRSRAVGDDEQADGLPLEVVGVWTLYALVACAIVVTYSRIPARELYHVSQNGIAGGVGRALVFANFSTALVALAVLAVVFDRLPGRVARSFAVGAAALCAAVFWPGVVSQADLDPKPVNGVAAAGVVLAAALTILLARTQGRSRRPWRRSDVLRVALAAPLVFLAAPWIAAELGFFLDGVPVLGRIFQTGTHVRNAAGLPAFPTAVHHGHHHGMDGLLLVLSALLLSRVVFEIASTALRVAAVAYLALMFCYGIGNIANDFWLEQVVKRGWTTWEIPNVLEPRLTAAWAIIVAAAATLWAVAMVRERGSVARPASGLGAAAQRE